MTEEAKKKRPTLKHAAALNLWRQGRDAWNSWIDKNPGWNISFKGVDFSPLSKTSRVVSFAGYNFGVGHVIFSDAKFGNNRVDFFRAEFGNSDVNFFNATFGTGHVNFSETTFGNGEVYFSGSTFGTGHVDFSRTTFGNGNVYFTGTTFDKGNVDFSGANFGKGDIDFCGTTFGDGNVIFHNVNLIRGKIDFSQTNIKNLQMKPRASEEFDIQAQGLVIKGRAIFELLSPASNLKSFDLHSASFDGPLTLKGNLSIIPDLRATRYSHQVDLSALTVKLRRSWQKPGLRPAQLRVKAVSETGIISQLAYKFAKKKWINLRHFNKLRRLWKQRCWPIKLSRAAEDPLDAARLRRLKEIAETNKDHQAALRFSADENRARRWIETSWLGSVLDMAFSFFCNYGQSVLRPTFWLGVIFALSTYAYKSKAVPKPLESWVDWPQAALLSASNSLPFLPQSRELRTGALTALYDTTDPSSYVDALMITQGVLSFIFLFLIGLGLRNRFRL